MAEANELTTVTPICTVAKKRSGSAFSRATAAAASDPFVEQRVDAAFAHGDHGNLRGGEKAVGENQREN